MRILQRIGIALAVFVALVVIGGFFVPSSWQVEESVEVAAAPVDILPLVETPRRWEEWAAWTKARYPDMESEYAGPERGAGAIWRWRGRSSGNGTLEITKSDPASGIDYVLTFEGFSPTPGGLRFETVPVGTRVVWWMKGDVGNNPLARYFSLLMEPMMGKDLRAGLGKLKAVAEAAAARRQKEERAAEAARAAKAHADVTAAGDGASGADGEPNAETDGASEEAAATP